jgi:uncharacterized protein (DUF927 family)
MEKKRRKNEDKINQGVPPHSPDKETQPIITLYNYNTNIISQLEEKASLFNSLRQKGFSEEAANDLIASGLSFEIIQEAGIQPAVEKEIIEKYHIHIVDRQARIKKYIPLYIIPYPVVDIKDQGKMVRVKVKPNPLYIQTDPSIKDTKYLQPSKEHLHYGSHLYILPSELKKLESPKCHIILVEGEKKTLKVIQEIRKIESQIGKYAVIGISGVHNWLNASEWSMIKLRGRRVIIFFDADAEKNTAVVEAEIQLTGYLYFQGASQILSARWDLRKGKGIDDYLTQEPNPSEALKNLIENAQDTIAAYRGRLQDRDIAKNFFLRIFEKKPSLSVASLENLSAVLEDKGIKKTVIKSGIKIAKTEIEEKLIEKHQEKIKEVFGVENIQIPEKFIWEEGFLKTKNGEIITEFFIVKSIVKGTNKTEGVIIKTITGKEIFISNQVQGKELKQLLQDNEVWIGDNVIWLASKYIAEYTYLNQTSIGRVKYSNQIGWEEENGNLIYVSPQTAREYIYDDNLRGYTAAGDKEKEKETVKKILQKGSILGLGYLGAVASLLVKPLEKVGARSFAVFLEGTAGAGKTTTAKFGLSLFGNPEKIIANMNTTSTGAEILFASRKDSLVILDEINTGGHYHISEHLLKLIYDFDSGKGRTRSTAKLSLRQTHTYRGVLFFTSETSFANLIKQTDKTVMGAYRRSIIVNYSDKKIDENDIETIYNSINQHHGNLLQEITEYIVENINALKDNYSKYKKQLASYKFRGQENHFALLYCAIDVLEAVLDVDLSTPQNTITDILGQIVEENAEEYKEATEITKEKLQQLIQKFVAKYNSYFPTGIENHTPQSVYGKVDGNTYYLTSLGFEALSKEIKIDIKSLKNLLVQFGMAETDGNRLLKYSSCSIAGKKFHAFKIQLSDEKDENQNQNNEEDKLDI